MQRRIPHIITTITLAFAATVPTSANLAYADKPEWAGQKEGREGKEGKENKHEGKHEKKEKKEKGGNDEGRSERGRDGQDDRDGREGRGGHRDRDEDRHGDHYFTEQHRVVIREYYAEQYREKRCPPGLAKKNNGCLPPGQAKKWFVGRPIPRDVIYYEVPQPVVIRLGPPPSGQRYVRVASDILLIAIGSGIVLDAINDLNR